MNNRFKNKTAFITGGTGALGAAIGKRIAEEGGTVFLADLAPEKSECVQAAFEGLTPPVILPLDVTSDEDWRRALDEVVATSGKLDVVVNAAGVVGNGAFLIDELPTAEWQRIMSVNVDGTFLGTREGIRVMKESGGGAVVNIGSTTAFVGSLDAIPYNVSKASVRALTRNAAFSAGKSGYKVRVNAVHPTWVWTPLVEAMLIKKFGSKEKALEVILAQHCVDRLPEPADIANAVAFLASDEAAIVTGADLVVDGGRTLG
ncbi:SDR family NAD(P)-dependent oxidoreductase [Celeribacter sp. PS-C1]|uniref:SDR family NAD(P)-dependent oxidoreductase n=1 Tax=Celeribacter sp. PS-C1 TaxID=2820813 RepID=UPI001CA53FA4|nr:SDR family oxidoreductase [Celeribacter sp. PS-C1]MBW6419756.1 SDR family oxidoreductase [Celeribacter sp. PS-C1]